MIIEQKLKDIQSRAAEIEKQMNSGNVSGAELTKLSKEYSIRFNQINNASKMTGIHQSFFKNLYNKPLIFSYEIIIKT